ncbi:MAG: PIG-L deacetylase family protein [Oscillochloridaceae bacterium umkhey_bin13]
MSEEPSGPITILAIAAHADDLEFGVGGAVARWIEEGHCVVYCIITDGSAGSNDPATNPAALVETRQTEQLAAAAAVGVSDVRFLGYRDGTLTATLELRRELTRLIRKVRPYRVICQDPSTYFAGSGYINHPDHRAAGEAAIYAVFPSAETRPIFPELLDEGLEPHKVHEVYLTLTLHPDTYVDITAQMERKLAALLCHQSQVGPDAADWVRQWDAEYGLKAGTTYAEAFRVMRLG